MAEKDPTIEAPKRRRRWYQYSLRSLLVVTLLASIALSLAMVVRARMNRGNVRGTVTVDGAPLRIGSITFIPTGGTATKKEKKRTAPIQGGQYALKRKLAPGSYKVEIRAPQKVGSDTVETIPAVYNAHTALRVQIMPGENQCDFALAGGSTSGERP